MFLGLDLGTTNVKALVAGASGETLGQGSCSTELFHVGEGGVEQDLEQIRAAVIEAIHQATKTIKPSEVRAVGVSSQGGALQVLDGRNRPLGRVISWLDQRGRPHNSALTAELGPPWFVQRIGHGRAGLAIGQVLRLRRESRALLEPTHRIGFVGDCIVAWLCGRAAQDGTSGSLTCLYNPQLRSYDPDVLQRLGLRPEQLPDLVRPGMAAGGVSPETARATGLSAGTPVSAAIHDQYAAALGTGAVRPGRTMLGTGTVWVLLAVSDRPAEPVLENAFVCHHVVEGLYGQIVSLVNGGSAVSWAMDVMGLGATDSGTLDQLLAKAPAASGGLCFYPFLAPSAPSGLTPGMKGRLAGLQLSHRPEHLARAVVEGLGFELKRHLECVQRAGIAVDKLVVGGAASTSRHTPQILADITRLPLACRSSEGASVLGAAVLARGLREPEHPLADLASEMVPPAREILPGPDAALYAGCFEKYMASLTSEFRSPGSE